MNDEFPEHEPGSIDAFRAKLDAEMQRAVDSIFLTHPDIDLLRGPLGPKGAPDDS